MSRLPRLALAALCLQLTAVAVVAEPLGRLFFTPERRAALERQRQFNIQETQAFEGAVVSLDGLVLRSGGKHTAWVNQRPQDEAATASGVTVRPGLIPGQATVVTGDENPAQLKVGESLNRATGEKASGLGDGRLAVPARR